MPKSGGVRKAYQLQLLRGVIGHHRLTHLPMVLHLHDNHGIHDEHLVPGEGTLNYGEILMKLEAINFRGMGVLELNWDISTGRGIRDSLRYLSDLGVEIT